MINPIKRAAIILGACAVLFLATLFIPAVKHSHYVHFLQGGAAGGGLAAVIMLHLPRISVTIRLNESKG